MFNSYHAPICIHMYDLSSPLQIPGATPTMITTNMTFRPAGLQFVNCTGRENKLIDCPTTASQSLLASNLNSVFAAGVYCLNSTCKCCPAMYVQTLVRVPLTYMYMYMYVHAVTTATSVGSMDTNTTSRSILTRVRY